MLRTVTDANPPTTPQSEEPVDQLSARQRAFVDAYLVNRNAAQAAREAGYSEKTAKQQGSRLLAHPEVKKAVNAGLAQLAEDAGVRAEWIVARLKKIAAEDGNDRVKACELLGKYKRMWSDEAAPNGLTLEQLVPRLVPREPKPVVPAASPVPAPAPTQPARDAEVVVWSPPRMLPAHKPSFDVWKHLRNG